MGTYTEWNRKQKGFLAFLIWVGYTALWTIVLSDEPHPFWLTQVLILIVLICMGCGYMLCKVLSKFFNWLGDNNDCY